jgi:hypothetical protein
VTELIFNGRSEDGTHINLEDTQGNKFRLQMSDDVKAAINQPRLVAVSNPKHQGDPAEPALVTVKEIQSRLRTGETMNEISESTDWSIAKIEKYSGPILQERAYVISIAVKTLLRKDAYSPNLENAAIAQLAPRGVNIDEIEWNTFRNHDGTWEIKLSYPTREGISYARWNFDLQKHVLQTVDEGAKWISGEEAHSRVKTPSHGLVYPNEPITPAPRLVAVRKASQEIELPIEPDAKKDGVTKRVKIPSWDDIMFGGKNESEEV